MIMKITHSSLDRLNTSYKKLMYFFENKLKRVFLSSVHLFFISNSRNQLNFFTEELRKPSRQVVYL